MMYVAKTGIWESQNLHSDAWGKKTPRWRNIEVKLKSGYKMSNLRLLVGVKNYFLVDIRYQLSYVYYIDLAGGLSWLKKSSFGHAGCPALNQI